MSRKRGQIENRGRGKWRVRVYLGRDGEGKRLYRSETVEGSKKEAQKVLTSLLSKHDQNALKPRTNHTVAQWCRLWVAGRKDVARSTRRNYRQTLERYVIAHIGGLKLSNVNRHTIQSLWNRLHEEEDFAPATLHSANVVFGAALRAAVADGILGQDPTKGVSLPKRKRKTRTKTLSRREVALFLETAWQRAEDETHPAALKEQWPALWTVLFTTGLRPGEAFALRWSDLKDGKLHIERSLREVSKRVYEIVDETKTSSSRRTVSLPETTLEALRVHKASQARRVLKKGGRYNRDADLIFAGRDGDNLIPSTVQRKWKQAVEDAGLDSDIRLYDTRHTHATNLMETGVNPTVVKDRLGHSSVRTTLDLYSHVSPELREETADQVEKMLFG